MRKTHCKNGHERTPENLEQNDCKVCRRERQRQKRIVLRERAKVDALAAAELARQRDRDNARRRKVYATDLEYRERINASQRERYATDPQYRERVLNRIHQRYVTDPEYRERIKVSSRHYQLTKGRDGSRKVEDSVWRERQRAHKRAYKERQRAALKAEKKTVLVDTAPFIGWLDGWLDDNPGRTITELCEEVGSSLRTVWTWRNDPGKRADLAVIDRWVTTMGVPWMLDELYPLEDNVAA